MSKRIIILCLLLGYGITQAHQTELSSTILSEQGENKWVLQIRASLTAFEYEIEHHFGANAYSTPEEFKMLVSKYVQEHTSILFNGTEYGELKEVAVRLGHETRVVFQVLAKPATIHTLEVKNNSFQDVARNQNALLVVRKGFSKQQFSLNEENDHRISLKVGQSCFEQLGRDESQPFRLILLVGLIVILLTGILLAYQKRQRPSIFSPT
ncbi:MAG: DUF6702 family protein [Bacteroidota bacterium]